MMSSDSRVTNPITFTPLPGMIDDGDRNVEAALLAHEGVEQIARG